MTSDRILNGKLDFLYMDNPGALVESQDWSSGTTIQSYDWLGYYQKIRNVGTLGIPKYMTMLSNGMLPYSSIGYLEIPKSMWLQFKANQADWAIPARRFLQRKCQENPGYINVLMSDTVDSQPNIYSYAIAYGWSAVTKNPNHIPWLHAALEYRAAELVPDGIQGPWWEQAAPDHEAFVLKKGSHTIVNVLGHNPAASTVAIQLKPEVLSGSVKYLRRVLEMNEASAPGRAFRDVSMDVYVCPDTTKTDDFTIPVVYSAASNTSLLSTMILSDVWAIVRKTGDASSQVCQLGLPNNYGVKVEFDRISKIYTVTTQYKMAQVFFPFARLSGDLVGIDHWTEPGSDGVVLQFPEARPGAENAYSFSLTYDNAKPF